MFIVQWCIWQNTNTKKVQNNDKHKGTVRIMSVNANCNLKHTISEVARQKQ